MLRFPCRKWTFGSGCRNAGEVRSRSEIPLYQLLYDGEEPPNLLDLPKRKADSKLFGATGPSTRVLVKFRKLLGQTNRKKPKYPVVCGSVDGEAEGGTLKLQRSPRDIPGDVALSVRCFQVGRLHQHVDIYHFKLT